MTRKLAILITLLALLLVSSVAFAQQPPQNRAERAGLRFLEGMIDHHQMALDMANDCLTKATTESVRTLCQNIITAQSREITAMRGWLLVLYGVEYMPMSMMHSQGGGMMDMMGMMSDMMGMMQGMMGGGMMEGGMMGGMMQGGGMMGQAGATPEATEDHSAHHPAGEATPEATPDHSQHQQGGQQHQQGQQDHSQHQQGGQAHSDPQMMMGMMAGLHMLSGTDYEIAWLEAMIDHHDDAIHMSERLLENTQEGTSLDPLRAIAQQIITDQTAEIEAMEAMITELGGQ